MKKILHRLKTHIQDFKINFEKKFKEYKEKPKSKRKSFIIGFTTAVSIFGLTLLGPALSAVAKDIPKVIPKPTDIAPAPYVSPPPSKEIINAGISVGSVYALAITTGSFAIGVVCGCLVVIGILQIQGK